MKDFNASAVKKLQEKFPDAVTGVKTYLDEVTLLLKPEDITAVCRFLYEDEDTAFNYLSDVCGVDYPGEQPRFEVVYNLYSMKNKNRIRLKVRVDENRAVPSVSSIWRGADWFEREVFDMFGIKFSGHPNLKRLLMPDDWTGHPLRKDYPPAGYKPAKWSMKDRPW